MADNPDDIEFCRVALKFSPLSYQEDLLTDKHDRIAVRFCRQAGKTTTLAAKAILTALRSPKITVLIVAPGMRQSMLMMDKVQEHLARMDEKYRKLSVARIQRTIVSFRNGSKILALPCSENMIRGVTANLILADESSFFQRDEYIFNSVLLPMLATTRGSLIVCSTPWSTKSMFYEFTKGKLSHRFQQYHATWEDAVREGHNHTLQEPPKLSTKTRRIAILGLEQLQEFQQVGRIPKYALEERKQGFGARPFKLFQTTIGKEDLKYLYKRDGLAANAVDVPAYDVFSKWFNVKAYSGKAVDSKLEDAIWELNQRLNVKGVFLEAYRYCRLYGLGIVVLGLIDSASDISQPPEKVKGIEYLVAYSSAEVNRILFDENPESRTYGEIQAYEINTKGKTGNETRTVHARRVVHVMEKTIEKSPWGLSILEPAFDLFQILKNIDWAAGEAYYQNASPTFVLSYEGTPSEDQLDQAEEDLKEITVKSRYIKPKNWELSTVAGSGQALDPTLYWEPIVERIAGAVKVPKQLLLGTAAGALASGQVNLVQYYKDVASIQSDFIEPLLMEFYRRLQGWGILPEGDFDLVWNTLWEMDEKEKAQIILTKAQTAQILFPIVRRREWILRNVLGMTVEEVQAEIGDEEAARRAVPA